MIEWESLRQITAVMKRSKSQSNLTSSTQLRTKDQFVIHDRCDGWISNSINRGLQWYNYISDFLVGLTVQMDKFAPLFFG